MKLTAPKEISWIIALVVGLVGILLHYRVVTVPQLAPYSFELLVTGFALLVMAPLFKGL